MVLKGNGTDTGTRDNKEKSSKGFDQNGFRVGMGHC